VTPTAILPIRHRRHGPFLRRGYHWSRLFGTRAAADRPAQRHSRPRHPAFSSERRPLDHVGCHTSRSMRPRVFRKRLPVK